MKHLKQSIAIGLLCFVVLTAILYSFFAFTKFDLNPSKWGELNRLGFTLLEALAIVVSCVVGAILYEYLNKEKQ